MSTGHWRVGVCMARRPIVGATVDKAGSTTAMAVEVAVALLATAAAAVPVHRARSSIPAQAVAVDQVAGHSLLAVLAAWGRLVALERRAELTEVVGAVARQGTAAKGRAEMASCGCIGRS